jgi:hypothetical protein
MIRPGQENNIQSIDDKIAAACRDAGEQVIERAERTGTDVVVWQDGEIVRLSAAEARAKLTQQKDRPTSDG